MRKLILSAFLICLCCAWLPAFSLAETKRVKLSGKKNSGKEKQSEKVVNILADKLEKIDSENKIIGTGNVKIKHLNMRISADKIELNTETGLGAAVGNVVLLDEVNGHKIHSPFMIFNFNSQKVTLYNSEGMVAKDYYVHGKKMERVSENHYVITKGDVTTCTGIHPAWKFKCSKVDAYTGDYAILHNPTFLIKDTPFFYLPYGYLPLDMKRTSGFLIPQVGNSQADGTFFSDSFFWAINDQWDATFGVDYFSERGVRPSVEVRYFTSPTTKGEFYGNILRDSKTDETYWKILYDHRQKLPYQVELTTNIDWQGGADYGKILSDSVGTRTRRETDSYVALTKNWDYRTLFFETRYHRSLETGNGNESGKLPQISFRNQLQKIPQTPFYAELDTSYSNFSHKNSSDDKIDLTQRFDVHPQISLPINKWPWLTVTPKIGVRETIYDRGKRTNKKDYDDFLYRTVYNFNTTVDGPSFSKVYYPKSGEGTAFKHLIEPRIIHRYIPDIGKVRKKIVVSDGIDTINKVNSIKYSLTNRLFEKILKGDAFGTKERIRFEISQSYDFFEAERGSGARPFSDIRFDFDSKPFDKLMFNLDSTYSVYDNWMNSLNVEAVVKPLDHLGFYLERRYRRSISTDILGTVRWKFARSWEFDFSTRYDEKRERFREKDASLFYDAQCWGIGVDVIRRTNYYRGSKFEDTRFLFQVSLKGLGTYGTRNEKGLHKRF